MNSRDDGWDSRVAAWARARPDIEALVQIGSRVQAGSTVDPWSDYDYHLITAAPEQYRDGSFCRELGPCWASGAQVAFGNAVKATGVYAGALEADFVVLANWEVRVAAAALSWPLLAPLWPTPLRRGIENLRIVAAPGWKVIKGGEAWMRRYSRLLPLRLPLTAREFAALSGEFWTQLVWAAKKVERGEFRAAQRALHLHLVENSLRMLQEEAIQDGRPSYPLGRRAELWLSIEQAQATDFATAPDRVTLHAALARIAEVFARSSSVVAGRNGWTVEGRDEVRAWLDGLRSH